MEVRDPNLRDALVSQAYRKAEHPEPSPALDARILEAARQAVVPQAAHKRTRWFTWALPLSTVAVLVLGLTVLLEIQLQAPEYMEPPGARTMPDQMADGAVAPQPAEPTVSLPYGAPEASAPQTEAADSVEPVPRAMVRTPRRVPEKASEAVSSMGQENAPAKQWSTSQVAPEPQPLPGQSGTAPAMPAPPKAAVKAESHEMSVAPSLAHQDAVSDRAGPPAASMAAPPPASAAAPGRESAATFSSTPDKRKAIAPQIEGPEQMVETIRRLMREGRVEEARKELERLRRAYPGFTLPEDLKGL